MIGCTKEYLIPPKSDDSRTGTVKEFVHSFTVLVLFIVDMLLRTAL